MAILQAAGVVGTAAEVVGIAIAVNIFAYLLRSKPRKWGIRLNNLLGGLKLLMLTMTVIAGFIYVNTGVSEYANLKSVTSFATTSQRATDVHAKAEFLVYVLFIHFSGFESANYVYAPFCLSLLREPCLPDSGASEDRWFSHRVWTKVQPRACSDLRPVHDDQHSPCRWHLPNASTSGLKN